MLGAIMGIGAGIAKGIMGNQAKKDQFEENKQQHQALIVQKLILILKIIKNGKRI